MALVVLVRIFPALIKRTSYKTGSSLMHLPLSFSDAGTVPPTMSSIVVTQARRNGVPPCRCLGQELRHTTGTESMKGYSLVLTSP
jgi:hypothetical protein